MRFVSMLVLTVACSAPPAEPLAPHTIDADAPHRPEPVAAAAAASPLRDSVPTPQILAAHAAALAHVLPGGDDPFTAIVNADARLWRFVPIEPAAALDRFTTALGTAARAPVRIAMYGASGTAADTHTAYVRAYLQARFGDGGPGFVPLGRAKAWSRHAEVTIRASKGWKAMHAVRHEDGSVVALGPSGLAFESRRAKAWVELEGRRGQSVTRLEVLALAQPGGGTMRVRIDGGEISNHATTSSQAALMRVPFDVDAGAHEIRLELAGDGPVRLFGVVFEGSSGIVVDTLGIDGARARNWQRWDPKVWQDAISARPPTLVTLAYGTNEAVDLDRPLEAFTEDFARVLQRLRTALPDAACVVLGPGDFPERTDAGFVPRPRLAAIIAIERELAAEHGCGFWDELAFMGGPGSMARWVASDPPLARDDHLHFRPAGAAVKGHFLVDALVLGYDAGG